jgi:hypothetical protein
MAATEEITPKTKRSDFQDIKAVLSFCGARARHHNVPFEDIICLIIFLLYNFPSLTPHELGGQLEEIFKEIHSPNMSWFYDNHVTVDRKHRHTLAIIKLSAEALRDNNRIMSPDDASWQMATQDTHELMLAILNYYILGCPPVKRSVK